MNPALIFPGALSALVLTHEPYVTPNSMCFEALSNKRFRITPIIGINEFRVLVIPESVCKVELETDHPGWVTVPERLVLAATKRAFDVTVDPTRLGPG